jgi:hypothetical protein
MGRSAKAGACALALGALISTGANARHNVPTRCATASELTAIAATAIQQQLMVAALTCNRVDNFNAFQTSYNSELRASDKALMRMFLRLYSGRGEAEYHAFKTRLANNSEMRSIHGNRDYCSAADLVFAAALAPAKPSLSDFVSGVQVADPSPIESCELTVTASLNGALAVSPIMPREKPAQFVDLTAPAGVPAPAAPPAATTAAATQAPTADEQAQAKAEATDDSKKKKSGWLSGIFN